MESQNTKTLNSFFDAFNSGDLDRAFQWVDSDAVWWVPGSLPFSGEKTKAAYFAIAQGIQSNFPDGFKISVKSILAEGERIALEAESDGVHRNGRLYNNKYHFLFELRGGKIIRVKEYMDTMHLAQLIAP